FTCDENYEDPRCMVVSPGMIDQRPNMFRDSLGRTYFQLPDCHGLSYMTTTSAIYNSCKASGVGFYGDRSVTILKWLDRLEATTGISRGNGLQECQLRDGRQVYILVIASSDRPDNVPRPAARIQKFKEILRTKKEPRVRRLVQPRVRLRFRISSCQARTNRLKRRARDVVSVTVGLLTFGLASTVCRCRLSTAPTEYTCDENHADPRRMVITPGLIGQKPDVFRDSLGRTYFQLPPCHGLCYVTSTSMIYNSCKNSGVGFYGDRSVTILKWLDRLEAATGISKRNGVYQSELRDGRLVYILVVSSSERPDTIPRPAARIQKFKEILQTKREPIVRRLIQPRVRLPLTFTAAYSPIPIDILLTSLHLILDKSSAALFTRYRHVHVICYPMLFCVRWQNPQTHAQEVENLDGVAGSGRYEQDDSAPLSQLHS
ncbi:hypothetical protein HDZ31DRAFT_42320, partial [Schizophyllum fasciatum]